MSDTRKVLHKLKRRFGRERARLDKLASMGNSNPMWVERCRYEAAQWSAAMDLLDRELRRLSEESQ